MLERKKAQLASPPTTAEDAQEAQQGGGGIIGQQPQQAAPSTSNVRFNPYDTTSSSSQAPKGPQGKFYCELCKIYSNDQSTFNLHLAGKKHKLNLQRLGQSDPISPGTATPISPMSIINLPRYHIPTNHPRSQFTPTLTNTPTNPEDDNMLNSKLEALTPSTTDIIALRHLVEAVTAKLGEFNENSQHNQHPEASTTTTTTTTTTTSTTGPVVVETNIVGPYAWGTMLKTNLVADMVVVTKDPPTFNTLRILKQAFEASIPNSTVEIGKDTMDMHVRDNSGYTVHLLFTWLGTWTSGFRSDDFPEPTTTTAATTTTTPVAVEPPSSSVTQQPPGAPPAPPPQTIPSPTPPSLDINYTATQKALLMIHQTMWFTQNSVSPNIRQCIKIMKDLHHRHPAFAVLNDWALEVIVVNALRALPLSASISQSLRAIFAFIASGMLLPGVDLLDPCTRSASVLQDLTQESRLAITKAAQQILNDIAFGRWEVIIG